MADPTLAELFDASGSNTVTHRGRVVRSVVRVPVPRGAIVRVERSAVAANGRPQALNLAVRSGMLEVNGKRAPELALWSTTCPDNVDVHVHADEATTIDVWNAWAVGGVTCAWIGNAGIVSRVSDQGQVLQCSDGVGQASFRDLVVTLRVIS